MRTMMRTMRTKTLWGVALGSSLLCAPAWALRIDPGAADGKKTERNASSLRLTTTEHAGPSFLSLRLASGLPPGLAKRDELPPGLEKGNLGRPDPGEAWRGHRGDPIPTSDATAVPEPSALLFFGAGLLIARRAIGWA